MDMTIFRARREALAAQMRALGGGVAIVPTAPEAMRNRDAEYDYRHDSYFYYLCGFAEPHAVLVLVADAQTTRSVLFCRDKDSEREIWDGYRLGPDAAPAALGVDAAFSIGAIDAEMPRLIADRPALFHALGESAALDTQVQRWLETVRAQRRTGVNAPRAAHDLHALLDELRLFKDRHEIETMRRAARISANAHLRAMRATRPGRHEYEIEAELLHEFRRHGSRAPAYTSIVAGGANACVLHYNANDALLADGSLLLIDAGCEFESYASDITRTFPINGRFSAAQRALYELVLAAQQAAFDTVKPGAPFAAPHDAAVRTLTQGLIDLGLCTGTLDDAIGSGAYRRFYMHRTSHWIGMDVHDVGDYRERNGVEPNGSAASGEQGADDAAHEPPWRVLQPGMALTIEPGLYVRAAADVPEQYWNTGIRIEDDVLVTHAGCENLTVDAPKLPEDIERVMQGE